MLCMEAQTRVQASALRNDSLATWAEVSEHRAWNGLLVGNGASMAIWSRFGYSSLFDEAQKPVLQNPLDSQAIGLFSKLKTTNFEGVLAALKTAGDVSEALSLGSQAMRTTYKGVQTALFEAVAGVHIQRSQIDDLCLSSIRGALRSHRIVFSTNYDLLLYWAVMSPGDALGFADYFWAGDHIFDVWNVGVWGENTTRLLYLHGGLHLERLDDGRTRKRVAQGVDLLSSFSTRYEDARTPLLVSEGTSEDKFAAMARSDYLSFALGSLAAFEDPLVIFGHALGDQDTHIIQALRKHPARPLAIAIHQSTPDVRAAKDRFYAALRSDLIFFFDSETHPLGAPSLRAADPFGL